ncbi:hypothetical protein K435DRAFT_782260 [Dendrothele bispora CBS 962.96]|uniref:HTH APSES-type domain-containing protein n=1 Tax=Dendrothele bispora (strain CBS 962.96) TaxID=1314807 RepID=A0A4S8LG76_DENBC|nr:hypothetical protein K435DRAFT_782260 [Dendrothele bispora CBS 962.96]
MQTGRPAPNQPPVKIYNAVYSSVQVYECMIRGIAVMRRRGDSFVNATQILKVAGVDKGRRTKILEKEILPGKHEIVQGGYGKYQGTWIPLERGRDIAMQYGVLPLLAPLFDFTPSTSSLQALPVSAPTISVSPRPLSAASSYGSLGNVGSSSNYMSSMPSMLAPPPIMPGSALRLLNQGRAQGLFTPSTSSASVVGVSARSTQPSPTPALAQSPFSAASQTPPPSQSLKRQRSDPDAETPSSSQDVQMLDGTGPPPSGPQPNGDTGPSPAKRARTDSVPNGQGVSLPNATRPPSAATNKVTSATPTNDNLRVPRFATKPSYPRNLDPTIPLKDTRRAAVIASICQADEPVAILNLLRELAPIPINGTSPAASNRTIDVDTILDDQGHTALHLASSLSRLSTVQALISHGADIHRGNHLGETPLIRTILATHASSNQSLSTLLQVGLSQSILTIDTSRKSVIHHVASLAGVKGRGVAARYYMDQIFYWIANQMGGDFGCIIDLQDEHGDTALNIAARVGSRTLVRTLLDVGANRTLMNKLGLKPGDFGVESEELNGGPRAEDIVSMLRSAPPAPVQKSQDVISDMTAMIQGLASDFQTEIKVKQDSLDVTQAHLRAATRELSEQRKQIQAWQSRCAELELLSQRTKNLEKAIQDEDQWDWTGRSEATNIYQVPGNEPQDKDTMVIDDANRLPDEDADASADDDDEAMPEKTSPSTNTISPAFRYRGPSSTLVGMSGSSELSAVAQNPSVSVDPDPPIPTTNNVETLIKLRRMKMWHMRLEELMEERLKGLKGASTEKEYMCRRIVALCTGVPVDKVDEMLDNLVIAMESEAQVIDIGRVSGFMQKVRDGII